MDGIAEVLVSYKVETPVLARRDAIVPWPGALSDTLTATILTPNIQMSTISSFISITLLLPSPTSDFVNNAITCCDSNDGRVRSCLGESWQSKLASQITTTALDGDTFLNILEHHPHPSVTFVCDSS